MRNISNENILSRPPPSLSLFHLSFTSQFFSMATNKWFGLVSEDDSWILLKVRYCVPPWLPVPPGGAVVACVVPSASPGPGLGLG